MLTGQYSYPIGGMQRLVLHGEHEALRSALDPMDYEVRCNAALPRLLTMSGTMKGDHANESCATTSGRRDRLPGE